MLHSISIVLLFTAIAIICSRLTSVEKRIKTLEDTVGTPSASHNSCSDEIVTEMEHILEAGQAYGLDKKIYNLIEHWAQQLRTVR